MSSANLECEDFSAAQQAMERTKINARWQADMGPFFDLSAGGRPDTASERLQEIFHLD